MSNHSPSSSVENAGQIITGDSATSIAAKPTDKTLPPTNPLKDSWMNKHASASGSSSSPYNMQWRLTRTILKDGNLNVYRPPPEITARSFDPLAQSTKPESVHTTATTVQPSQTSVSSKSVHSTQNHKRILSNSTTTGSLGGSTLASRNGGFNGVLSYEGKERHPDLTYDAKGRLIGGTDEAICHTILFGDSDEFTVTSVELMPLLSDIVVMFKILTAYSKSSLPFRSSLSATDKAKLIQRLKLVVITSLDQFPGMLLDSQIMATLLELVEQVSSYDDPLCNELKRSVVEKQSNMTRLLYYSEDAFWGVQPFMVSERVRAFFHRIDTSHAGTPRQDTVQQFRPVTTIPAEIFLEINQKTWSTQIYQFHLQFSREWSPTDDISLLFRTKYNYQRHSPLVFDSTNIHFLGRVIIDHLFDTQSKHGRESEFRGRLITHWIDLGNELKTCGDMVGWLAIATVLCSVPVMRLRDAWGHVAADLRERIVKEWAPVVFDLERRLMVADMSKKSTYHVLAPQGIGVSYPKERVVPFFGDLCVKYEEGSTYRQCESRLNRVKTAFQKWRDYLENISQDEEFPPPAIPNPQMQKLLYALLKYHYDNPIPSPEQVLQLSLNVEPAASGNYLKHHYVHKSPLVTGSYLPTIFTETDPSYRLFSKSALIAASGVQHGLTKRTKRNERDNTSSNLQGSSSYRHGSTSGQSVVSSVSSNSSSTSLQGFNQSGVPLQRSNSYPPSGKQPATTTGLIEIDFSSRQFMTKHSSRHALVKDVRDVLNVGTRLYHLGNEIIVKCVDEGAASRPSSVIETPSKRYSTQSRPLSAQFASLSPQSSSSGQVDLSALKGSFDKLVVVRAANLERLVDILVLGINQFNHFLNPEDIDSSETSRQPHLKIDMDANTLTFFATFRSFCSPMDLLESFRRRFVGARSAALAISEVSKSPVASSQNLTDDMTSYRNRFGESEESLDGNAFPHWDAVCEESDDKLPWANVAQIQMGVLEACLFWVSHYFGDFVNDLRVRDGFLELFKVFEAEINIWKGPSETNEEYRKYYGMIETLCKKIRKLFIKKSYRPHNVKIQVPFPSVTGNRVDRSLFSGGLLAIEGFLEDINIIVSGYYSAISLKDWVEVFEALEVQSADMLGFFNYRPPAFHTEEEVVIQNIYSYLETLYRESPDDKVLKLLPKAVQDLFRLHSNVVNYLTAQLADPFIDKGERINRMLVVLKALGIAKQRMRHLDLFAGEDHLSPHETQSEYHSGLSTTIPSFLESALVQAITRPESRMYANSWLESGKEIARHFPTSAGPGSHLSMATLIPHIPEFPPEVLKLQASAKPLVPCAGWVIERMLEIVCYVPNLSLENNTLINYDKRRYIFNLATNVMDLNKSYATKSSKDGDNFLALPADSPFLNKMAYILNPDKNLYHLDRRSVRDAANREAKDYPRAQLKNRVFTTLVSMEVDKQKRDARQQESIERQVRDMKRARYKQPQGAGSTASVASDKKTKSRFGGLFKATVRPISMALSGPFSAQTNEKIVSVSELPDINSLPEGRCKHMFSIPLANAEITSLRPFRLPCSFKLTTDGIDHVFQALTEQDADEWMSLIAAGRRYATFIVEQEPVSSKLFGIPVASIVQREGNNIPSVVTTLLTEIESRGLDEVGLYRVPGSLASVNALKAAFDAGEDVSMEDERWYDINTVAGCFKLYLRELPESLFTMELFGEFMRAGADVSRLRKVSKKLPQPNFNLLKRVFEHLALVAAHGEINRMHAVNLAIVFSMSFLPRSNAATSVSGDLAGMQTIMKSMISFHDDIFAPGDGNTDSSDEDELTDHASDSVSVQKDTAPRPSIDESLNSESGHEEEANEKTTENGDDVHRNVKRESFTEVSAY